MALPVSAYELVGVLGSCETDRTDSNVNKSEASQMLIESRTGKCYEFGSRGPCGENMIFYSHPLNPKYGFCDCDQGYRSQRPCSDHPVRRLIYVRSMQKCLPVFSQGPCQSGQWLNFKSDSVSETEIPVCEPNPCINFNRVYDWRSSRNSRQFIFHDPLRKRCYESQKRGYCPPGMTLEITHESHIPKCRKVLCEGSLTNFRSFLSCRSGSRYSYLLRGCTRKPAVRSGGYVKIIG